MSTLNANIPRFYCLLRKEFLYDGTAHTEEFVKVCVFGISSIYGRALGFHVLTETGAVIWRLPIHALCHKESAPIVPLNVLQFWDCISYEVSSIVFDRLKETRVRLQMKDGGWIHGQYMFTLDWHGFEDAEEVGDGGHKCAHILALDDGNFAAQPNNRIQWFDPAFVTPFKEKPDFLTNTRVWRVERETETSNGYFYDSMNGNGKSSEKQLEFPEHLHVKGLRT